MHKLDNETSELVEEFVAEQQARMEYTPPDNHGQNSAERCVQTWKNHSGAGFAGLPPSFPMAQWCRTTEQADHTLNMMRPCCQNPALSAFEAMEGMYSFHRNQLVGHIVG